MTKLPDDAERALRRLDDEDDLEDGGLAAVKPDRLVELFDALRDRSAVMFLAKAGFGADRLAPARRRVRGQRRHKPDPLAFAVDDVGRLKGTLPVALAELVAAERCRRSSPHADTSGKVRDRYGMWGQWCTVERYSERLVIDEDGADDDELDLDELVAKLHKRLHRGATGAERRRRRARAK